MKGVLRSKSENHLRILKISVQNEEKFLHTFIFSPNKILEFDLTKFIKLDILTLFSLKIVSKTAIFKMAERGSLQNYHFRHSVKF